MTPKACHQEMLHHKTTAFRAWSASCCPTQTRATPFLTQHWSRDLLTNQNIHQRDGAHGSLHGGGVGPL